MEKTSLVLRHYNKVKPINCSIISGDTKKVFTVKLHEGEKSGAEILKGDPVLIGFLKNDDTLNINGGNIVGAMPKEDEYIIYSNNPENIAIEMERRQYERFPTSLLGEMKLADSSKREPICIKDFSYAGMCVYSTDDFNEEDEVEASVFLSSSVIKYDAKIVRKTINFGRFEYGVQLLHRDKNSMYATQNQLTTLMQNEKELIYRHLMNARFKL
ncbi:MAG TPA: PilZ domain-containing protein [Ruminiclostridium sp.]|nr:PilZ domain-containing protein [Ruminiclostridium sp.]